ncbi:baseplate hub + tail lysozyme [Synechococcus phage ACG-2014a]|nr:baseplate hub + tail lysozyme [Synechococcus phage ACG-2014a]
MINTPPSVIPKALTGIRRFVGGSVETVMTPGLSADAIPRYTIANPLGPYSGTFGATGYNCNVLTGAFNVNVAAGFIFMDASLAVTLKAGLGMVLSAGGVVIITGKSIFLN